MLVLGYSIHGASPFFDFQTLGLGLGLGLLITVVHVMERNSRNRGGAYYPLYAALAVGVGAVSGAIYANPLIHLKFIWVFFGLIVSLQFIERCGSNEKTR